MNIECNECEGVGTLNGLTLDDCPHCGGSGETKESIIMSRVVVESTVRSNAEACCPECGEGIDTNDDDGDYEICADCRH